MTRWRRTHVAAAAVAAVAAALLLSGCSDDTGDEPDAGPRPQESTSPTSTADTPSTGAPSSRSGKPRTRHSDAELVAALPDAADERHGLAAVESCTDFDAPGECLGQEEGTVVVNLADGMDQGILVTVARTYTRADVTARGALCPAGPIEEPASDAGIPGRQGTGERTRWEHRGWSGWVCEAEYTQGDSDGSTEDSYSLRLLLAHDGHHLLSLQTASDVDVAQWAEEYVDRLEG